MPLPRITESHLAQNLIALADSAAAAIPITAANTRPLAQDLAFPAIRFTSKTNREDPRAATRKVVNFQRQLDKITASFKTFQVKAGAQSSLEPLKEMVQELYKAIDLDLRTDFTDWDPASFSRYFTELNKSHREEFAKMKTIRYNDDAKSERAELSSKFIEAYKFMIKLRLKQVEVFLAQAQGSPKQVCNKALPILAQADATADRLRQELNWSKNREDTNERTADMQTLDTLGRTIWGIDLAKLDMKLEDNVTSITQRIWIKPQSYIALVLSDLKDQDVVSASERIDDLIKLYSPDGERQTLLGNTTSICTNLETLSQLITDHQAEEAIPSEIINLIKQTQALITPPDQAHPIFKEFKFSKDPAAGLRSRVYILQNNTEDFRTVAKVISYLENLSGQGEGRKRSVYNVPGLLSTASRTCKLSADDFETLNSDLAQIIEWLNLGNVDPKQAARQFLREAPGIIAKGYAAQKDTPEEAARCYRHAASLIKSSVLKLRKRLNDIAGIARGTKTKFDALLIAYKDMHIKAASAEVLKLFKQGNYTKASDELNEIRELYFNHLSPEPGYHRVANNLARLENSIRKANRPLPSTAQVHDVEYYANLTSLDIDHKHELRLSIFDLDQPPARAKFVFTKPKTEADFLQAMGGKSHIAFKNPRDLTEAGYRSDSSRDLEDETEYFIASQEFEGLSPQVIPGRAPIFNKNPYV